MSTAEQSLANAGVFKGMHGLEGLANCQEFWDQQPYGTRLYYGDGGADYLHRDVLRAAIRLLSGKPERPSPSPSVSDTCPHCWGDPCTCSDFDASPEMGDQ